MRRLPRALSGAVAGALIVSLALAQDGPPDQKQLAAQARQLVAEAQALEHAGELAEAKEKYVDAEGVAPSGEALSAIARINAQQGKQVDQLLAAARQLFEAKQFAQSADKLERAADLQPARPALQYDLALCYLELGDRVNAEAHLDAAIGLLTGKERADLLELRSTIVMGTASGQFTTDARKALETFNDSYLQQDRDPIDPHAAGGSLCTQMTQLQATFPSNTAVLYNSAKCALQDARADDSARLLTDYARLAPTALDESDAAAMRQVWSSLARLPGQAGQVARAHYAAASRDLDDHRYNLAIAEYEAAAQAVPDFPRTQWELAVLYDAYGDAARAGEHFARFQELEPLAERRADADAHLSTFDGRRALYDTNVARAEAVMGDLIRTSLGIESEGSKHRTKLTRSEKHWAARQFKDAAQATQALPEPYIERQLNSAREDLLAATDLFPLGAAANELLALIALQDNDWADAYRSYDAVASQGLPVSFYAQVTDSRNRSVVLATKVEIGTEAIRFLYLSSYSLKTQISTPPSNPAGNDQLGNLIVSHEQALDTQAQMLTLHPAELRGIETSQNLVVLKLADRQLYVAPLNILTETPYRGGAARGFGNAYTKLFARYLGYEHAKLGPEGMSISEKFGVFWLVARVGMSVGMMGVGAPAAFNSALRMAKLARDSATGGHAMALARLEKDLQLVQSVNKDARIAKVGGDAMSLNDKLKVSTLEQVASDQRRTIEGMVLKVIPAGPRTSMFREKF
jgi:tetratricopeptide (TPR) repeat protein